MARCLGLQRLADGLPLYSLPCHPSIHMSPPALPHTPPQVEATKFTEVGFHGRDVDQIIRDLVDNAIIMMRQVGLHIGGSLASEEAWREWDGRGVRRNLYWVKPSAAVPSAAVDSCTALQPLGKLAAAQPGWRRLQPPLLPCPSHLPQRLRKEMKKAIDEAVEERILNALLGETVDSDTRRQFRMLYRCACCGLASVPEGRGRSHLHRLDCFEF